MPTEKFEIRGRAVSSETRRGTSAMRVTVDRREIPIERDADTGKYSTVLMPFRDYDSVKELVESLIANHPDFRDPRQRK